MPSLLTYFSDWTALLAKLKTWNHGRRKLLKSAWTHLVAPIYVAGADVLNRGEFEYEGVTLDLTFESIHPVFQYRIRRGLINYEEAEWKFVEAYVDSTTDVIELGGGIGFISCYTNDLLEPSVKHVVVEADETLLPVIENNRALNDCEFQTVHAAYSSAESPITFNRHRKFYSSNTTTASADVYETAVVDGRSIRSFVNEYELSEFTLICDIEGAESDLLENELAALEERCSTMIVEFHDNANAMLEILENSAFDLVDSGPQGDVHVFHRCD